MSVISLIMLWAMATPHATPTATAGDRATEIRSHATRSMKRLAPLELVDRRLRDLVAQQESWFVREGRYTRDAYRAGQARRGHELAYAEVEVSVLYAGKNGWSAVASHPSAPGRTCVAFVGVRDRLPIVPRTHTDGREAMFEGIPACDTK